MTRDRGKATPRPPHVESIEAKLYFELAAEGITGPAAIAAVEQIMKPGQGGIILRGEETDGTS